MGGPVAGATSGNGAGGKVSSLAEVSTALAEVMLAGKDLRTARAAAADVLRDPPQIIPPGASDGVVTTQA